MNKTDKKIKALKKEAHKLWKIAVIERYGGICTYCGKPSGPPHHYFIQAQFAHMRYDIENGCPLCVGCHFAHHHKSDPRIHHKIDALRGKEWHDKLKEKAENKPSTYRGVKYYEEVIAKLDEPN